MEVIATRAPWILRGMASLAPAAAEQPESARSEVSESSTSLTGESNPDTTDADTSVLDPTFTSCLGRR